MLKIRNNPKVPAYITIQPSLCRLRFLSRQTSFSIHEVTTQIENEVWRLVNMVHAESEEVVDEYSECLGASPYLFEAKRSDTKDAGVVTPTVHMFPADRLDRVGNNLWKVLDLKLCR